MAWQLKRVSTPEEIWFQDKQQKQNQKRNINRALLKRNVLKFLKSQQSNGVQRIMTYIPSRIQFKLLKMNNNHSKGPKR